MINLHQGANLTEASPATTPMLEGGRSVSTALPDAKSINFDAVLTRSKSEQDSPPMATKLAAVVAPFSVQTSLSPQTKSLLSTLTPEELKFALMSQTTVSTSEEGLEMPDELKRWIDSEALADEELSEQESTELGLQANDESEATRKQTIALSAINEALPSADASSHKNGIVEAQLATAESKAAEVGAVKSELETSLTAREAVIKGTDAVDAENLSQAITDSNIAKGDSATERLVADGKTNNEAMPETVTGINSLGSLSQQENPQNSKVSAVNERLNPAATLSPLEHSKLTEEAALTSVKVGKESKLSEGEIKPISLLVSATEVKSNEPAKVASLESVSSKPNEKSGEVKLQEMVLNTASSTKEPESLPPAGLQAPTLGESAKLERFQLEPQTAPNLVQKAVKLPEVIPTLSDRIHTMIKKDIQHGFIRLDPPELGALEVRVQVTQESTQIQIISQSPQVREALESQSIRLRESLAEQGLTLANLDVSDQSSESASDHTGEGQDNRGSENIAEDDSQNIDSESNTYSTNSLVDHYV